MKVHGYIDRPRRGPFAPALLSLTAVALAGCGIGDGAGVMLVDPGHYSAYHCNELAARWKVLVARDNELRGLMDKASEGAGGYDSVVTEERLVQRAAADKNCGFTPDYQSDHTIR
jgi:hypothetical protein